MSLGSKQILISNALTFLFGEGYSSRCTRVPDEVHFVDSVRHHDANGVSFLPKQVQVVAVTNGHAEAEVTVEFAVCEVCFATTYKVIGLRYTLEYQPTPTGQSAIMHGVQPDLFINY